MRIAMTQGTRIGNIVTIIVLVAIAAFAIIEWLLPAFLAGRIRGWDLVLLGCGGVFLLIMLGSWIAKLRDIKTSVWLDEEGAHEESADGKRDVPWAEIRGVRFEFDDICIETPGATMRLWCPGLDERRGRYQKDWIHRKLQEARARGPA